MRGAFNATPSVTSWIPGSEPFGNSLAGRVTNGVPPPPLENANRRNRLSEAMAAPFGKIEYLYVGTSDFERDLAYYTNVLGAKVIWNRHAFGAKVASLRLCKGLQYLLADHRPAPSCLPLFEVPDLKATSKQLRSRGWKSKGRSFEIPPGPCILFKDPSGNELALFENVRPNVMGEGFED